MVDYEPLTCIAHGYRENGVSPKPIGSLSAVSRQEQKVLESIINHPERVVCERPHPDFGKVIDIIVPDKWGERYIQVLPQQRFAHCYFAVEPIHQ